MKWPDPMEYSISQSFIRAAELSRTGMEHFARTDPTIAASLAVQSGARGSRKPLKKAGDLKKHFFRAM